jgi:hypothetical protein
MARKSRPTFKKRQKEIARQQKARDKMTRRMAKKEDGELPSLPPGEEDPDIAGIQPGPQPLPEEWNYVPRPLPSRAPEKEAGNDRSADQRKGDDPSHKGSHSP